jgi:hypothetical protein
MSNETYSLVLNSQNATNRGANTTLSSISYNVNWDSILPRKYSQYSLNWQLKSNSQNTISFVGTIANNTNAAQIKITGNYGTIYAGMQFLIPNGNVVSISGLVSAGVWSLKENTTANVASQTYYSINNQFVNNIACFINFGKQLTVDQSNGQSNLIGFSYPSITPISTNINSYSYYSSTLDNGNIQLAYPTNQNITVKFTNVDLSTAPTLFTDYSLQLYFTPIITDQEAINNAALLAGKF